MSRLLFIFVQYSGCFCFRNSYRVFTGGCHLYIILFYSAGMRLFKKFKGDRLYELGSSLTSMIIIIVRIEIVFTLIFVTFLVIMLIFL